MSDIKRPREVVVVDAENPMEEIHGEFFWREDHDRIVAREREDAFRQGYADGYAAARGEQVPKLVIRRRRGTGSLLLRALALLLAVAYAVTLVGSLVHT